MSQRAWNLLAKEFEDSVCDITATSGDVLEELVLRTRPSRRRTLVDAGCGIGTFIERFGNRFGRLVAFDFAPAMVRRARRRCRELQHATWHSMPLEEAGERIGPIAHLAVCLNVITAPNADLRERQWRGLADLVRPAGHLLVVVPSLESARFTAELESTAEKLSLGASCDLIRRADTKQKHYSRSELRQQVARQQFKVISLRKIPYPWSEEGLDRTSGKTPWDWVCLAKKTA